MDNDNAAQTGAEGAAAPEASPDPRLEQIVDTQRQMATVLQAMTESIRELQTPREAPGGGASSAKVSAAERFAAESGLSAESFAAAVDERAADLARGAAREELRPITAAIEAVRNVSEIHPDYAENESKVAAWVKTQPAVLKQVSARRESDPEAAILIGYNAWKAAHAAEAPAAAAPQNGAPDPARAARKRQAGVPTGGQLHEPYAAEPDSADTTRLRDKRKIAHDKDDEASWDEYTDEATSPMISVMFAEIDRKRELRGERV